VTGSEELRTRLARAGVIRARSFTWQQTAQRILAVFDEVVPMAPADIPVAAARS
jgi:hypothetical protein